MEKRFVLVATILCLLLSFGACSGSNQMTRARALELIRHSQEVKETASTRILTGRSTDLAGSRGKYNALQSIGLLIISGPEDRQAVHLTPQGRSQGSKVNGLDNPLFGIEAWDFVTASGREVVAVTGIRNEKQGKQIADFTWKWKLTPIGEALAKEGQSYNSVQASKDANPLEQGEALFTLYDDGWRLEGVQWAR